MKFKIKNIVLEESNNILIKGFYDFYEKMNGKEGNFIDSFDNNLDLSVETVEEINKNPNIILLYIYNDSGKLLGFSRFTYKINALVISEIIVIEETKELTLLDIYYKTIQFYEEKAKLLGFANVNLEVPVFDMYYVEVAQLLSYEVVSPSTNNLVEEKTVIFEKELNRNRSDDFGRNLINKQD